MKTIYVSIPDIGDSELKVTVANLFESASNPERVFVGLGHSIPFNNKNYISNIEKIFSKFNNIKHCYINIYRNRGVSYGRRAAASNYNEEDFYLQVDSHTLFDDEWDNKLINLWNELEDKKAILTAYLPPYFYSDKNIRKFARGKRGVYPYYISGIEEESGIRPEIAASWKKWYPDIPMWMTPNLDHDRYDKFIKKKFVSSRKLCANFIFSDGQFARDYNKLFPVDTFFFEEEYLMSIEAYSLNYHFIYPNVDLPLGHLYTDEFNKFYPGRPSVELDEKAYFKIQKNLQEYLKKSQEKIKLYAAYAGLTYPDMNTMGTEYIPKEGR